MRLSNCKKKVEAIQRALERNDGYCPCVPDSNGNEDWKCPCKEMRENNVCKCGLYKE